MTLSDVPVRISPMPAKIPERKPGVGLVKENASPNKVPLLTYLVSR